MVKTGIIDLHSQSPALRRSETRPSQIKVGWGDKHIWKKNARSTTGSPGVIGSEVTFVRFGSNMKPRYLGTSNHIIKVGIEAFSYGKWGTRWGLGAKNEQNNHFCSNFSLKSKMTFRIQNRRQETLCYTKIVQGIQIWGQIFNSAIYYSDKFSKSHWNPTIFH